MFTTAFCIEIFVSSRQTWAKLSVGIVLAMMILAVFWSVWVTVEAGTGFSILSSVHLRRDRLHGPTEGVPEPGSDAGDCDGDGRGGKHRRSRSLKEVFNFIRRPRRQRTAAPTPSTLVNFDLTGSNGSCRPPYSPGVEVEIHKEQGSAV